MRQYLLLTITTLFVFLAGCASLSSQQNTLQISNTAENYLQQAANAQGDDKAIYQLMATNQLLDDRNLNDAEQVLSRVQQQPLNPTNVQQKLIIEAKLALQQKQSQKAVTIFQQIKSPAALPENIQQLYYQTAVTLYSHTNRLADSVIAQIHLTQLTSDADDANEITQNIWHNLQRLPLQQLQTLSKYQSSDLVNGWLQLAIIAKQYANQTKNLATQLMQWQQKYPSHPAISLLPNADTLNSMSQTQAPQQIALLLPLHGPFASMGTAVRDGFMMNFYNNAKYLQNTPTIKVYDTSKDDILTLYQQAVDDGAQFVIGPLTKDNVNRLAGQNKITVPTLVLNYLDTNQSPPDNLIQFGLSPMQSAQQIAAFAWAHGSDQLLTLSAQSDWATQILQTFNDSYRQLGGNIAIATQFTDDQSIKSSISSALNIDQSNQRAQSLQDLFGEPIKAIPRRRQDINGIFLIATPAQARQIIPLLKFYYTENLPIFSISNVYSGAPSPRNDHDLNGIYFNDIPLLLSDNYSTLRNKLASLWASNYQTNNRLYGLGLDADTLSMLWPRFIAAPNFPIQGVTGNLYLNQNQQIYRQLLDAEFQQGLPQEIE
ncbi:MAG: hypothetical protein A3C55_03455 [Gammaproteobacteria bacterium RIFCSPHIGHO2_02_FULL_42_13]|nr:MAG: hypothetical protein A3C55_03455 [Gammaproteobacteria bacterium RIFCSPHIGHO2_02_FULL_42_13]OGT70466.1 MAG: hypothetical protein A3H43_06220 [Gammaproteobacteria bacterium RIFCSPLOWO2_02_FULL_42_9]